MSGGWQTIYCRFPDEATARAVALQLGAKIDPVSFGGGDENYAFAAYIEYDRRPGTNGVDDAGQVTPGFWVLGRFNLDRPPGLAAFNAINATAYVAIPSNPDNVWAT